jgi:hypothetical protein
MIIVHAIVQPAAACDGFATATVWRKLLEPSEPQIPPGAIWVDLIEPTAEEDRKVQEFVGVRVPTKADPDYTGEGHAHASSEILRADRPAGTNADGGPGADFRCDADRHLGVRLFQRIRTHGSRYLLKPDRAR